jgi:hypothetical protein
MPAPKGSKNGQAAWIGQFKPATEPKVKIDSKVPKSLAEKFLELLEPGESKSAAIVKAIELLIKDRESRVS